MNKTKCMLCDKPSVWVRSTQFAGDHPFCDAHAKQEEDFKQDDSYTYWYNMNEDRLTTHEQQQEWLKNVRRTEY
jgi:endogenous inhibitor of DNA gyrase (YacG/DUF329 family)